jgi:CRISPR system Cascade subunit CasD
MNVLLLRLAGPMQSWGVQSRFTERDTGSEPSKSGVVGLLCAALGRPREAPIDDLAALRMGVRADREGIIRRDFQTAGQGGILKAQGKVERKNAVISNRYYLADASFLVGLEGENLELLQRVQNALRNPHWGLYLGRKAFVPGQPVWLPDGLRKGQPLRQALESYPLVGRPREAAAQLRMVMEDPTGAHLRPDQPLSFAQRLFAPRRVTVDFIERPAEPRVEE